MGQDITITFNSFEGFGGRVISHICSSTLELTSTYESYDIFEDEFDHFLNDKDFTWVMSTI